MLRLAQAMRLHDHHIANSPSVSKFVATMAVLSTQECGFNDTVDTVTVRVNTARHEDSNRATTLMTDLWSACGVDATPYSHINITTHSSTIRMMRSGCLAVASSGVPGSISVMNREGTVMQKIKISEQYHAQEMALVCHDQAVVSINEALLVTLHFTNERHTFELVDAQRFLKKPSKVAAGTSARSVWISDDTMYGITEFRISEWGQKAHLRQSRFIPIEMLPIRIRGTSQCRIPTWSFHIDQTKFVVRNDLGTILTSHVDDVNSDLVPSPADIRMPCAKCGMARITYHPEGYKTPNKCLMCKNTTSRHGVAPPQIPPPHECYAPIEFGEICFLTGSDNSVVATDWNVVIPLHDDTGIVIGLHNDLDAITMTPTGRCLVASHHVDNKNHHIQSVSTVF